MHKAAGRWQLEDGHVAHEQRRDEHGVHLVQRVVEWGQAEHDAHGPAAHLHADAGHVRPLGEAHADRGVLAELFDNRGNEVHGAVKFFGGVTAILADFPHEQVDDVGTDLAELRDERLDRRNAVRKRHLGPLALAPVPRGGSGLDGLEGIVRGELGQAADDRAGAGPLVIDWGRDLRARSGKRQLLATDEFEHPVHHGLLVIPLRRRSHRERRQVGARELFIRGPRHNRCARNEEQREPARHVWP
mmetsp:Transcript_5497/g.18608  ORF Transcript_5497/g.18608 Transcript_5497/m.18608 type:complete len:245 (-) Transcript_5497:2-736(-)